MERHLPQSDLNRQTNNPRKYSGSALDRCCADESDVETVKSFQTAGGQTIIVQFSIFFTILPTC